MAKEDCLHEGTISYGETVFETSKFLVLQVQCDDCLAYGTVYEEWDISTEDYTQQAESWHNRAHYRKDTEEDDYAHCKTCDTVINLDKDVGWQAIKDNTYCVRCAVKERL